MKNILIVGAGNLGCRHLQALARLHNKVNILVVDPQIEALTRAENSWNEVAKDIETNVSFYQDFNFNTTEIEIAIIVTNSNIRADVTKEMLSKLHVKNIVFEKFLFPASDQYYEINSLLESKRIKAWVNCPRRLYSFYKELREKITGTINFSVSGGNWGIACNSIHFLDLFSMLSQRIPNAVDAMLDNEVLPSKREGYIEFSGSVFGRTVTGDTFHINATANDDRPLVICITDDEKTIHINEVERYYVMLSKDSKNADNRSVSFETPYQSQLTNIVVDSILDTGSCELTEYTESCELHIQLLNVFLDHYNNITQKADNKLCPIT